MSVMALVPVVGRADSQGGGPSAALAIVAGAPLLTHAVRRLLASEVVDRVLVVTGSDLTEPDLAALADALPADPRVETVPGPLARAALSHPSAPTVVLVHDPLRAFAPAAVVARVVAEVTATGRPVVPVLPCSDTVQLLDPADVVIDTPDRAGLRVAQTPVGFPASALGDPAVRLDAVPVGARVVDGDPDARRLASPVGLAVARGGAR